MNRRLPRCVLRFEFRVPSSDVCNCMKKAKGLRVHRWYAHPASVTHCCKPLCVSDGEPWGAQLHLDAMTCARGCIVCMRVRDDANVYVHIDTRTRTRETGNEEQSRYFSWGVANTSRSRRGANRTTIRNSMRLRLRSPPAYSMRLEYTHIDHSGSVVIPQVNGHHLCYLHMRVCIFSSSLTFLSFFEEAVMSASLLLLLSPRVSCASL